MSKATYLSFVWAFSAVVGWLVVATACSSSGGGSGDSSGGGSGDSSGGAATGSGGSEAGAAGESNAIGGVNSSAGGASSSSAGTSATGAPTWTDIYAQYFTADTAGHCASCHSFGSSADSLYSMLQQRNQISGTSSKIVTGSSILVWFGGSMPRGGSADNPAAVDALKAWVADGALNN
jgi:hypothetical protein